MATPAEVAARDGITKQAVTKMVRRLVEEHGLPVERDGRERIVRFSLAHFDHLRGDFSSSEKVAAARQQKPEPPADSSTSRDEALRLEAWLRVNRQQIELAESAGRLVRKDRLQQGLTQCGNEIRAIIGRMPNKADDLALAVTREGVHGLRIAMRQLAVEVSTQVADALATIGAGAPEQDPIEVEA